MSIKRYIATKDNTISAAFRENLTSRSFNANMGASDILELFSIYGQATTSSLERTRILSEFPIDSISNDRDKSVLPPSGSVRFKLRFFNSEHGQTTPENYELVAHPILRSWNEGIGLDMESYLNTEASNWLSASSGVEWHSTGSDFGKSTHITSSIPMEHTQFLSQGTEDLSIDITGLVEEWIRYYKGDSAAATGSISLSTNPSVQANGNLIFSSPIPNFEESFTISDQGGTSVEFIFKNAAHVTDGTQEAGKFVIGIAGGPSNTVVATRTKEVLAVAFTANSVGITIDYTDGADTISLKRNTPGTGSSNPINTSAVQGLASTGWDYNLTYHKLRASSHEGQTKLYTFITSSTYSVGDNVYLMVGNSISTTIDSLKTRIDSDFSGKIITKKTGASLLSLTQSVAGLHGQTYLSKSVALGATVLQFNGARGMPNYGMTLKLAEEYENGSKQRSYYTKKFLARGSHEYLRRPSIEAQWDKSVKDDRNYIVKSSSLAPAEENLNTIFLYNKRRGSFYDLPNTGSSLVVSLHAAPSPSSAGERLVPNAGGVLSNSVRHITASRHDFGIYKATFAYTGSQTFVYDVWGRSTAGVPTTLATGSGFKIYDNSHDNSYEAPSYILNITNLKDSYLKDERTTFRIYTRDKNWQPNIYTKANNQAPVNNIRDLFYKITKVFDNYEVVSYSTGSTPSYSSVSYDNKGSFFDLDMTLLEPNNAYEISFLLKDGPDYLEQPEKFRFRVEP